MVTVPFGKYRGQQLDSIEENYLRWLLTIDLRPWLQSAVEEELAERRERERWRRRFSEAYEAGRKAREEQHATTREHRGVDGAVALAIVREGYRQLSLRHHPDTQGGDTMTMQKVTLAANWLRHTVGRMLPVGTNGTGT